MCLRLENGASPIQFAPSPPIWVKPEVVAVHPLRHVVAADAGIGARAFRHHGRGIVRAARAEIGRALGDVAAPRQGAPARWRSPPGRAQRRRRPAIAEAARRARSRCRWDRARHGPGGATRPFSSFLPITVRLVRE